MAPGRLSVSRTFGDLEAKQTELGGMPGVVVSTPDVDVVKNVNSDVDWLVIGSDGIYDKLKNRDINEIVWNQVNECVMNPQISIH